MGKKNKDGRNLGKALIRDRFGPSRSKKHGDSSMLHSADINDGYDWGRLNLQSVTEESSFQEFLSIAELAGTEFHAEKLNIKFVNPKSGIGLLSKEEKEKLLQTQAKNKQFLKIPRRPKWNESTTASELETLEKEQFLEWRRQLAFLQENQDLMLTPYEKNLEFWRQLWRVIERSDIIVQIVDARNPLLFRCEDLESYVKEINPSKMNITLVNKADLLTQDQRKAWCNYFTENNIHAVFFSATLATECNKIDEEKECENSSLSSEQHDDSCNESETDKKSSYSTEDSLSDRDYNKSGNETAECSVECVKNIDNEAKNEEYTKVEKDPCALTGLKASLNEIKKQMDKEKELKIQNSPELLTRDKLILYFKSIYKGNTFTQGITTIGLVGYPNVGKSSTINALLANKKTSVSATPGKTKHFQTLYLDTDLLLCDSPGLVMPSFVSTKAEMILNGILPIDQMRDHVPPITLLGTLIPKHIIEDRYGIMLPSPLEGEDPDRPPTSEEILNAYGYNRGFMTQNGQPDNPRSARYILKDFINGKLLYCVAPPNKKQEEFHPFPSRKRTFPINKHIPARTISANKGYKMTSEDLDRTFFQQSTQQAHVRGNPGKICNVPQNYVQIGTGSVTESTQSLVHEEKPWKKINKHRNKNKREKTRRLYYYLDQQ